ncbi:UNVERIFIED_ORG: regulatory protein [Pseudomonas psychrophila]
MIDIALDRLTEEGLLSESRYLESYINYRAGSGYGPLRIREELGQRGLSRGDIEEALRESGFNWQEQLEDTWRRKFAGKLPEDAKERARQGRFLSYRGYTMDMIGRVLSGREFDD